MLARIVGGGAAIETIVTGRTAAIAIGAASGAVAVVAGFPSSIEQQQFASIVGDDGACLRSFVIFAGQQHEARATLSCAQRYIANA